MIGQKTFNKGIKVQIIILDAKKYLLTELLI